MNHRDQFGRICSNKNMQRLSVSVRVQYHRIGGRVGLTNERVERGFVAAGAVYSAPAAASRPEHGLNVPPRIPDRQLENHRSCEFLLEQHDRCRSKWNAIYPTIGE